MALQLIMLTFSTDALRMLIWDENGLN